VTPLPYEIFLVYSRIYLALRLAISGPSPEIVVSGQSVCSTAPLIFPTANVLPSWPRRLTGLVLFAFITTTSVMAQDLIHYWNFNNPASGTPWPQPIAATVGSGSITYSFQSGVVTFAGTTFNARQGSSAGDAFVVQGGPGLANNNQHFQLNISTQGYESLRLTYATRGTATGFNMQRTEFSVDGGASWTHIGTETGSRATTFYGVEYNLASFTALNNAPNVIIRFTLDGITSETGNNRFDNIAIDGTFVGGVSGTGTGSVTMGETLLAGGRSQSLRFEVAAISDDPEESLSAVSMTLPQGWGPITAADVDVSDDEAMVAVEGSTIRVSGLAVTETDGVTIDLRDVAVPDVSGAFQFQVATASGNDAPSLIAGQPRLLVYGTPIPIAEAGRNTATGVSAYLGQYITIRGVVTVSNQFGPGPVYLQDETGGFAVYAPQRVTPNVALGEEVTLFGRVAQFNGLNQLDDQTVIADRHGMPGMPEPVVVTLSQLSGDGIGGVEVYEGRLIRVNSVSVNTPFWNVEGPGTNYQLTDATGTLTTRISPNVDFVGQAAPSGTFDILGVVGQFVQSAPFIGGYQLLPRFRGDIVDGSAAPAIVSLPPYETAATANSITFRWTTSAPGTTEIRYGVTTAHELGRLEDADSRTEHTITLDNLQPATIYNVQFRSAVGTDTTKSLNYLVSTGSPAGSTGQIIAYFNKGVDLSIAREQPANQNIDLVARLVERINAAQSTIDVSFYSLSGNTAGALIANALINAHNRGVRVRVIMETATSETAPPRNLRTAGVPFITDDFGANVGSEGLQHNKTAVFDLEGPPQNVWVMTGSWNPTEPGSFTHHQNVLFIQDVALARAYTAEFEQMWGSSTTTPNAAASRFGRNKRLVTPSVFWIDDAEVRLFFSPQGWGVYGTTEQQIINTLAKAQASIDLGLNLITRQSLVDAMRQRHDEGVKVRGVVGETATTGSVFGPLSSWADVLEFSQSTFGLLHHKYALVDAEAPYGPSYVITGSHNWSRSANESNDENTLIISSRSLANQFQQEFAARYRQAGGQAQVGTATEPEGLPLTYTLSQNYPNPFNPATTISVTLPASAQVTLVVYDVLGREVARLADGMHPAGIHDFQFNAGNIASGTYLYRLEARDATGTAVQKSRTMVLVK
jgi:phosphatidylserine/phosphatidylglycerophosphate/cardiolipin synthase-like enzyme